MHCPNEIDVERILYGSRRDEKDMNITQPLLTRVSRQIRREALPLFYSENEFTINMRRNINLVNGCIRWLKRIGQDNRARLNLHLIFLYDDFKSDIASCLDKVGLVCSKEQWYKRKETFRLYNPERSRTQEYDAVKLDFRVQTGSIHVNGS